MKRRQAIRKTALLAGSATVSGALFQLLQSCQDQSRLSWQPVFLNEDQARFISSMVDTWLPKTDTPGGLDMKVDLFIDSVFAKLYDQERQSQVVTEIEALNAHCVEKFGSNFADLSEADREEMMKMEESKSGKFNGSVWGTAVGKQEPVGFYRSLKSLALWGYFTSEGIGKNVLSYDPVPQEYLGCIPLSDVGNSWSL